MCSPARPRVWGAPSHGRRNSGGGLLSCGVATPADKPSVRLGELTQRWGQDALARGASWFGIACMCMPVIAVLDDYSVIDALIAAKSVGAWPEVPLRVWALLVWIVGCGVAAGRLIAWLAPGGRMRLFVAIAALHGGYGLLAGLRLAWLAGLVGFGLSFAALRAARDTWPLGHPGAPG